MRRTRVRPLRRRVVVVAATAAFVAILQPVSVVAEEGDPHAHYIGWNSRVRIVLEGTRVDEIRIHDAAGWPVAGTYAFARSSCPSHGYDAFTHCDPYGSVTPQTAFCERAGPLDVPDGGWDSITILIGDPFLGLLCTSTSGMPGFGTFGAVTASFSRK